VLRRGIFHVLLVEDPEVSVDPDTGEMVACDPVIRNWTGIFGTACPLYVSVTWIWQEPPGVYTAGLAVTVTCSGSGWAAACTMLIKAIQNRRSADTTIFKKGILLSFFNGIPKPSSHSYTFNEENPYMSEVVAGYSFYSPFCFFFKILITLPHPITMTIPNISGI